MTFLIAAIFPSVKSHFRRTFQRAMRLIIDRRLSKQPFLGIEAQIGDSVGR